MRAGVPAERRLTMRGLELLGRAIPSGLRKNPEQGLLRFETEKPQALGRMLLTDQNGGLLCVIVDSIVNRKKNVRLPSGYLLSGARLCGGDGRLLCELPKAAELRLRVSLEGEFSCETSAAGTGGKSPSAQAADAAEEYHTAHTGIKHPLTGWKDNARERIASSELTANVLREKIAALEPMVQQLAEQKFQDKKNAFADEAATKWLKTKYEQSLEAHIAQHPEYTEQQRQNVRNDSQSLENYIMEEKSSVLKDRKFKQFIDSIKDEESLKNMKELSDGKLFHTINNYWKTRPVDLDAEIAIAQGEIRTMTARNNGMIPEKEQMKQPLAVITAAYQVKSAQKNGISQNMTAGEFADLKAKYAKESPTFVEMFDRSDSQTLHNQATKDKGQNLMTNFINTMRIVLEEKAVDKENQNALEKNKQLENNKQRRVKGGA